MHEVQAVELPEHVKQFELQGKQVVPDVKYPAPHDPQVELLEDSKLGPVHAVQVTAVPAQARQLALQG